MKTWERVRVCTKCGAYKSPKEFYTEGKNKRYKWCAVCMREYQRARRKKIQTEEHIQVASKMCNRCHKVHPIEEYHRDKTQLDGHTGTCKMCCKAIRMEKESDPEYRKMVKERHDKWKANNPDKMAEYSRRASVKQKYKSKGVKVYK